MLNRICDLLKAVVAGCSASARISQADDARGTAQGRSLGSAMVAVPREPREWYSHSIAVLASNAEE